MYNWDEKFSVGIQSIDNQHKEIFKYLNLLLEALKQGKGSVATIQIVQELERYALVHFQKEEFFFIRFNYSGSANHITEHQLFIQKVNNLKSELKTGNVGLAFNLLTFLKDWIEHHILVVDKQYSECFRQNGLR